MGEKRTYLAWGQQVEIINYAASFGHADHSTMGQLASLAKEKFRLPTPPSVGFMSKRMTNKVAILRKLSC